MFEFSFVDQENFGFDRQVYMVSQKCRDVQNVLLDCNRIIQSVHT